MTYELEGAVVIGRMQLPHKPHLHLVTTALELASRVVVVLGSAFHSRNIKNPFTYSEREAMIRLCLTEEQNERVTFVPVRDYGNDAKWTEVVKAKVDRIIDSRERRVKCVGYFKDASSYYLNGLPWDVHNAGSPMDIDATALRNMMYESEDLGITFEVMKTYVPESVLKYIKAWSKLPHLQYLQEEYAKIQTERKTYGAPFGVTGDFVLRVVVKGVRYVLLVKRGRMPGRGAYAVPGGFYEPELNETLFQCALREAMEETQHTIWLPQLMAGYKGCKFYDNPYRSVRKNIMTMSHFFEVHLNELPPARGSKDPGESYSEYVREDLLPEMEDMFFDDHFIQLHDFLGFAIAD